MTPRGVEANATLYVEGAPAERVYYIAEGRAGLIREAGERKGSGVPWTTRNAGTLLGMEALVQNDYADTALALTRLTVCTALTSEFRPWAMEGTAAAARTLMELTVRAQCTTAPRPSSAEGTATQRVARWLADECRACVAPNIPRAVVAGLLGMLPETFSRALASLSAAGAIEVDRKSIRVVDTHRLLELAGE